VVVKATDSVVVLLVLKMEARKAWLELLVLKINQRN
jgi:hypothetical protein